MAKSKIIKELVNNEVSLSVALRRLLIFANDLNLEELLNWVKNETRGYESKNVPEYRKVSSLTFYYSGINGSYKMTRSVLDIGFFNKETLDKITVIDVKDSISELEIKQDSKNGKEICIDRSYLAGEIYKNSYDEWLGRGIQCTMISQMFHPEQFRNIYNKVFSMTLDILLELEKKFGNLDDLDIDTKNIQNDKIDDAKKQIQLIINYSAVTAGKDVNVKADNVVVGDGSVSNNLDKKKIKESNIGSGSNSVKKEFSPTLALDTKGIKEVIDKNASGEVE